MYVSEFFQFYDIHPRVSLLPLLSKVLLVMLLYEIFSLSWQLNLQVNRIIVETFLLPGPSTWNPDRNTQL